MATRPPSGLPVILFYLVARPGDKRAPVHVGIIFRSDCDSAVETAWSQCVYIPPVYPPPAPPSGFLCRAGGSVGLTPPRAAGPAPTPRAKHGGSDEHGRMLVTERSLEKKKDQCRSIHKQHSEIARASTAMSVALPEAGLAVSG